MHQSRAAGRDRTGDLVLTMHVLYQLSYCSTNHWMARTDKYKIIVTT